LTKPNYEKNEIVRIQRVKGGSIEVHGKFAGDIVKEVEEMSLVNLRQTGHHTLRVVGGEIKTVVQRVLPLTKVSKPKTAEQLFAVIAPSDEVLEHFRQMLVDRLIMEVTFDEDTGQYRLKIGHGKTKPEKQFYHLDFITAKITEVVPEKKQTKEKQSKKKAGK